MITRVGAAGPTETAAAKEPLLAGAEKSPYHEVAERIAAEGTHEHWVLAAAKRLQWVPQNTLRLSHLSDQSLRILLVRWTNLLEAAKEEPAGTAPEKTA